MSNKKIADSIGAEIVKSNPKYAEKSAQFLARLRWEMRRLEAGKCLWGKCPEPTNGARYCAIHKARSAEYQRVRRAGKGKSTKEIVG